MSFTLLQKLVTYLLAGLGLIAICFGGELSTLTMGLIAAGFALSFFAERPLIEQNWYTRGWLGAVIAALGLQISRGVAGSGGWLALAMEFAALLSISRLSNRRTAADYQQIAVLAFMHLIAATVLTTDLGYAGVFIAFVIATPWALSFAHLRAEIERNYPASGSAEEGTSVERVLKSRRIVGPAFLGFTALLSLPMFAMTIALFIIFPRVGLGMVSFGGARGQSVAGFGSSVELGGFGVIRTDPTVVLRMTPSRPLNPAEEHRYLRLRGTAFDHYDGVRWSRSSIPPVPMFPMGDYFALQRVPHKSDLSFKIVLDRLDEPVLFVPAGTVGLRIAERGIPGRRTRAQLSRGMGLDLRYQNADEFGIVYDAVVSTNDDDFDVPVARDMDDDRYLAQPLGHERVAALAKRLTEGYADPEQKARALEAYLRDEDRFAYSLQQPDTAGKLPLEVFLFEAKRGHCEYFATALAIMLRAVGIPARNVTGFVGGEYNDFGRYYSVRQSDAHSWVEAQIPERGWITLDPTPPSRDALGPGASLLTNLRKMIDAMRTYWMTQIVGYDLRSQITGLKKLRDFMRSLSLPSFGKNRHEQRVEHGAVTKPSSDGASTLALGATLLCLAGIGLAFFYLRRRAAKKPRLSASERRAVRLYRQLELALAQRGQARAPHVSPEAHARTLANQGFADAQVVELVTVRYLGARYGQHELSTRDASELGKMVDKIRRAA